MDSDKGVEFWRDFGWLLYYAVILAFVWVVVVPVAWEVLAWVFG